MLGKLCSRARANGHLVENRKNSCRHFGSHAYIEQPHSASGVANISRDCQRKSLRAKFGAVDKPSYLL
jgi:hypothetical protein